MPTVTGWVFMLPGNPPQDRQLASDDPALNPGWPLLRYLHSIGADEFAVSFTYAGDAEDQCDLLAGKLGFARIGERLRERTVTSAGQHNPRDTEVWHLNPVSLSALPEVLPDGVLGHSGQPG